MFSVSQFFVNLVHGKTFCSRSVKIESFGFLSPALQQYVSRYLPFYKKIPHK
jgi:hypothetical protein